MNAHTLNFTGHGHVVPREDGIRARCGGPALCSECKAEKAAVEAGTFNQEHTRLREPKFQSIVKRRHTRYSRESR